MATFWNLLERSIIVQSIVTLMLVTAVVFMYVTAKEVPSDLTSLMLLVLGFWFGAKSSNQMTTQALKKIKSEVQNANYSK